MPVRGVHRRWQRRRMQRAGGNTVLYEVFIDVSLIEKHGAHLR
jgi:hypothetical protein